jgi:hypothetical protein
VAKGEGDYITITASGVPQAGGSKGTAGTGGFVVAYLEGASGTPGEIIADPTIPQARLYVNVDQVDPPAVVGIVASPEIGIAKTSSFYYGNTCNRTAQSLIYFKFEDETTGPFDSDYGLDIRVGEFGGDTDENDAFYVKGGSEDSGLSGWFSRALLTSSAVPAGKIITFKATVKSHANEPAWTVSITTPILAGDPSVAP